MRRDAAASDVVGTILLMGVTVALMAGVALSLQQAAERTGTEDAPTMVLSVSGDSETVVLTHAGQGALDARALLLTMETASGDPLIAAGTTLADLDPSLDVFSIGEQVVLRFSACETSAWCVARPAGERVSVTLRSLAHDRAPVALASFSPQADATGAAPVIVATVPADGATVERGSMLRVALTASARNPSLVRAVSADLSALGGPAVLLLRDDGTEGDLVAGDGVYERHHMLPAGPAAQAGITFTLAASDRVLTHAVTVSLVDATAPPTWLQISVDDEAPWPDVAAPFSPVFVDGTNLHLVDSVVWRRADGTLTPATWMLMPTRPPGLQLQLLAPANPTESDEVHEILLFSPFSEHLVPGTLTVVPQSRAADHPPATLPGPVPLDPSAPVEYWPPRIDRVVGIETDGTSTLGRATAAFATVRVEGGDLDHVDRVYLSGGGRSIAVAWTRVDAGVITFVTHPGIPPGSYSVVASNPAYVATGGPLVVPAPGVPAILSLDNALPPGGPTGSPGDEIVVRGSELALAQRVQLVRGTETRALVWWLDGSELRALLPKPLPSGAHTLVVGGAAGSSSAAFTVVPAQPTIAAVSPSTVREFMQVDVTGTRLLSVTSTTLRSATGTTVSLPWIVVSDARLSFFVYPGIRPGVYDLVLSTGERSATASVVVESALGVAPSELALTPTSTLVEQPVTLSGRDLGGVSRIVLKETSSTNSVVASWYLENDVIRLTVPASAAPRGNFQLTYVVELTGAFVGRVEVPQQLTVLPPPAPTIASFTPSAGQPFTQIDITGTHFVNVNTVSLGDIPVYFTTVSPTRILAVTHSGVAPGTYAITVRTTTGSVTSSALFTAQAMRLVPVFDQTVIDSFGLTLSTVRTANHDPIQPIVVKIRAQPGWTITAVSAKPVNFAFTGSTPTEQLLTRDATCTGSISRWSVAQTPGLQNYNSLANQLNYVIGVTATSASGAASFNVVTNDHSRNFILPAAQMTDTIVDRGFPSTGFGGCGA